MRRSPRLTSPSYDWEFVPEAGKTFADSGTTHCHGAPPPPATDALAASFDATQPIPGPTGPGIARASEPGAAVAVLLALRPAP